MGELRFILLLAGLVFLVALAAWELRKPRQAQGDAALRGAKRNEPQIGSMGDGSMDHAAANSAHAASFTGAASAARSAPLAHAELPDARRSVTGRPPRIDLPDLPAMEAVAAESILADADAMHAFDTLPAIDAADAAPLAEAAVAAEPGMASEAVGAAASTTEQQQPLPATTMAEMASGPPQIVIDWPPEGERHIIALRIVPAAQDERLSGRAVRLAITACGFVHGRFGIYHQPDGEGRALLSVASLSKPGILDPINMDFQRLAGINLFAVLPGPLSPGAALDHLLDTARELSQRLPARVQDETGHPLDAERLEDLRERMQSLSGA